MRVLVTGSSGHLGEALVRTLRESGHDVAGIDLVAGPFTTSVGCIGHRFLVERCMSGVEVIFHTATLHKPHVATHRRQDFVDVNITGTLTLLEAAVAANIRSFVFTSTTSVFGDALVPPVGAPAAWITEDVTPVPKNIYGVTKVAAEDLCQLFHRNEGLACIILRTSRFFPEEDDDPVARAAYTDDNLKVNEYLFRRVDIEDVVSAHLRAAELAPVLGFRRYIISATTPFAPSDVFELRDDARTVARRYVPAYEAEYARRRWTLMPSIDRVYDNARARTELAWQPRYDFAYLIDRLRADQAIRSPLAQLVGAKGYHRGRFTEGAYPVA